MVHECSGLFWILLILRCEGLIFWLGHRLDHGNIRASIFLWSGPLREDVRAAFDPRSTIYIGQFLWFAKLLVPVLSASFPLRDAWSFLSLKQAKWWVGSTISFIILDYFLHHRNPCLKNTILERLVYFSCTFMSLRVSTSIIDLKGRSAEKRQFPKMSTYVFS